MKTPSFLLLSFIAVASPAIAQQSAGGFCSRNAAVLTKQVQQVFNGLDKQATHELLSKISGATEATQRDNTYVAIPLEGKPESYPELVGEAIAGMAVETSYVILDAFGEGFEMLGLVSQYAPKSNLYQLNESLGGRGEGVKCALIQSSWKNVQKMVNSDDPQAQVNGIISLIALTAPPVGILGSGMGTPALQASLASEGLAMASAPALVLRTSVKISLADVASLLAPKMMMVSQAPQPKTTPVSSAAFSNEDVSFLEKTIERTLQPGLSHAKLGGALLELWRGVYRISERGVVNNFSFLNDAVRIQMKRLVDDAHTISISTTCYMQYVREIEFMEGTGEWRITPVCRNVFDACAGIRSVTKVLQSKL